MPRLIDADALKLNAWPEECTGEGVVYVEDIDNAPTVDAVEVVHCDECTKSGCCIIEERLVTARAKDRYCGLGERREGE